MGWSDLPSDLVISVASRLQDPIDYARFRAVCRSWESAVRGFRPAFFPWLALIPSNRDDPDQDELSFISHAGNDIYKRPMPSGNIHYIHLGESSVSNKDGWMMFVLVKDTMPIIVNPVTGSRLHLPSLGTFLDRQYRRWKYLYFVVFLAGNLVAFVNCWVDQRYHILAAATPGDDEWSFMRLSSSYGWKAPFLPNTMRSIVFHEADRKFYALHRDGDMQSFRLTRCGRKTVFGKVSYINAEAQQDLLIDSHLMSDGTNLLQVRKRRRTKEFDILKYCPDADMWVQLTNMDYFGNNSLFFDSSGARLLPLPLQRDGRLRRNCIYFTDYDSIPPPEGANKEEEEEEEEEEGYQYVHYVRIYDVDKGTVEPCFSTNIQSKNRRPAHMWFTPSLSVKN